MCGPKVDRSPLTTPPDYDAWAIHGEWYKVDDQFLQRNHPRSIGTLDQFRRSGNRDVTPLFVKSFPTPTCDQYEKGAPTKDTCVLDGAVGVTNYCHQVSVRELADTKMDMMVSFEWPTISSDRSSFMVYKGVVLDMSFFTNGAGVNGANVTAYLGSELDKVIRENIGRDATLSIMASNSLKRRAQCLVEKYQVGFVSQQSSGCFAASVLNTVSLTIVLGMMCARFVMAFLYSWLISPKLANEPRSISYIPPGNRKAVHMPSMVSQNSSLHTLPAPSGQAGNQSLVRAGVDKILPGVPSRENLPGIPTKHIDHLFGIYSVILVTCYSEDEDGLRTTLESIAETTYEDRYKLIFLVADGLVTGGGNDRSTPDICLSMLTLAPGSKKPPALSYIAVADGSKQHNMAKVVSLWSPSFSYRVSTLATLITTDAPCRPFSLSSVELPRKHRLLNLEIVASVTRRLSL